MATNLKNSSGYEQEVVIEGNRAAGTSPRKYSFAVDETKSIADALATLIDARPGWEVV